MRDVEIGIGSRLRVGAKIPAAGATSGKEGQTSALFEYEKPNPSLIHEELIAVKVGPDMMILNTDDYDEFLHEDVEESIDCHIRLPSSSNLGANKGSIMQSKSQHNLKINA